MTFIITVLSITVDIQMKRCETTDKGVNKLKALQSSISNLWWRTYGSTHNANIHTHTHTVSAALMCLSLHSCHRVCFWNGGGWRKWGGGTQTRRKREEADYLLGLLQRCLQPAYFFPKLLLHLMHLLVMSSHLFLQGSFQSCQLPLSPLQHILLLLLGQEKFLHLKLQLHHVLMKKEHLVTFEHVRTFRLKLTCGTPPWPSCVLWSGLMILTAATSQSWTNIWSTLPVLFLSLSERLSVKVLFQFDNVSNKLQIRHNNKFQCFTKEQ